MSGSQPDGGSAQHDTGTVEGGTGDSSNPTDGGPWSPICPATVPADNSSCEPSQENIVCEYGNAWWAVACDQVFVCGNGHWTPQRVSNESCFPEPGPNSPSCPASPADVMSGQACPSNNLLCLYAHGAYCACTAVSASNPDAGVSWKCGPGAGCPVNRPPLGAGCSVEAQSCVYNDDTSLIETCTNGVWQQGSGGA